MGREKGPSSKLVLSSEGIRRALSSPAESEGWIIESEENTTRALRKYSAESFRARLPVFTSCDVWKRYVVAVSIAEVFGAAVFEDLFLCPVFVLFLTNTNV